MKAPSRAFTSQSEKLSAFGHVERASTDRDPNSTEPSTGIWPDQSQKTNALHVGNSTTNDRQVVAPTARIPPNPISPLAG